MKRFLNTNPAKNCGAGDTSYTKVFKPFTLVSLVFKSS